jgi:S1-C subfamily serine protease
MARKPWLALAAALLGAGAACAEAPKAPPRHGSFDSPIPGTIRAFAETAAAGVRVVALAPSGPAARAGLQVGDIILRYNGTALTSERHFDRLVLDSPPGSTARLVVNRGGRSLTVDVPVEELPGSPRG